MRAGRTPARTGRSRRSGAPHERRSSIRLLATLTIAAILPLSTVAQASSRPARDAGHHVRRHHRPGCRSSGCDRRVDRAWARRHPPPVLITRFDLCVANQENGEPGASSFSTVNWRADNDYEGAFSWEPAKWEAGGGLRYARHPYEASPQEQIAVFHQNGRNGEWTLGNWPTIARC
jgi:hypothetical protein